MPFRIGWWMVGKEEAIEIHHWSNMIISVMSISGGIIEPNRNHSQLGSFFATRQWQQIWSVFDLWGSACHQSWPSATGQFAQDSEHTKTAQFNMRLGYEDYLAEAVYLWIQEARESAKRRRGYRDSWHHLLSGWG